MDNKQIFLNALSNYSESVIAIAYTYAKNIEAYGVDVTKVWNTATEQSASLEQAYKKGYSDAQKEITDQYAHFMEMNFPKSKEESNMLCTQKCCLKNHNVGIIECNEEYCSNRTKF